MKKKFTYFEGTWVFEDTGMVPFDVWVMHVDAREKWDKYDLATEKEMTKSHIRREQRKYRTKKEREEEEEEWRRMQAEEWNEEGWDEEEWNEWEEWNEG